MPACPHGTGRVCVVRVDPRLQPQYRHGLCSYGLYSYGLYSYGPIADTARWPWLYIGMAYGLRGYGSIWVYIRYLWRIYLWPVIYIVMAPVGSA